MKFPYFRRPAADKENPLAQQAAEPPVGDNAASPLQPALAGDDGRWSGRNQRWQERRVHLLESMAVGLGAYSTRSRTPFRCDGGQHSTVIADTVPR